MSVQKKRNRYYAVVTSGRVNGKYIREWSKGFNTLEEAELEEKAMKEGKETIEKFLVRWLKGKEIARKTRISYQQTIDKHIIPHVGRKYLSDIGVKDVEALHSLWKETLSDTSVGYNHRVLSSALKTAVGTGKLLANPCQLVTPPVKNKDTIHAYTYTDVVKVIKKASESVRTAIVIGYTTGMRRGEIMALKWEHISGDLIRVRYSRDDEETKLTKTNKPRTIYIMPPLKEYLDTLPHRDGYIVVKPDGIPPKPHFITTKFSQLAKDAGVHGMRFHDLRHIHATELLEANVHPAIVMDRLGHSTITTTYDIYSHVLPNMQEAALKKCKSVCRTIVER